MRTLLSKIENYPAHLEACWREHLAPRAPAAPTFVSLFAGCGGSSLGYSMAGFRELLAVEWDEHAVETFKANFPDVPVWHGDIAELSVEECLRLTGLQPGELDVLDGSPPCQGFSTAGRRKMDDGRNQLFQEYVRLLRGLRPKVLVMENVSYTYHVTKHIVPSFGKERIDSLDYPRLKAWVIEQAGKYSKDTVRLNVAVLRAMLQESVNEGILAVNPVMKPGKFYRSARRIKEKIDPFTIEELHLIEFTCRERIPGHYPFILCMARTGMRIGEATALQWHDIDFTNNYIVVRRNIPHHRQVETTKTEASQRKVDMSPELSAELRRLRTETKKQALADGKAFDAEGWVFPTEDGTPIFYTNFLRRVWHKVQDIAKVRRRTPHDLRHSWASHMLAAGADLAYVSNQLGHANPSITLRIYSHWVPGMRRITTAVLDTKNANNLQMEAATEEKENLGRP